MKVELSAKDEQIIAAKMKTGRYDTPADVVSNALALFNLTPGSRQEIVDHIDAGLASGPATPLTSDDLDQALQRGVRRARRDRPA